MSYPIASARLCQLVVGLIYLLVVTYAWATPPRTDQDTSPADDQVKKWSLATFERVYVEGNLQLDLEQHPIPGLVAYGESAILANLLVEVADGVLYLDARHVRHAETLQVRISVPSIREIVLDGHGVVVADDFSSRELVLEGVGAGIFDLRGLNVYELVVIGTGKTHFQLNGHAQHQSIHLAGSSTYDGDQLQSLTSEVSVRGEGDVSLWADEVLDVRVQGSANVRYSGGAQVHRRILGLGAVSRIPSLGVTAL